MSYIFKGISRSGHEKIDIICYKIYGLPESFLKEKSYAFGQACSGNRKYPGADIMRLQLISGAFVLYTLAVLAWLCYVGIGAQPWHA